MDCIYPYKHGWGDGLELKYSLRSLINFPHNKVYIIGDKPSWITGVVHIQADDKGKKFENVRNKFNTICENKDISDDFILMHDDFYFMEHIDTIPYYIRGTLKQHIDDIYNKFGENEYYNAIKLVYDKFPNGYSFDVHTPIIFNKEKFKKILELYPGDSGSKRSLYCNYYSIEGTQLENNDCKVFPKDRKYNQHKTFISSDDSTIRNLGFIKYINEKFPIKSKYEI